MRSETGPGWELRLGRWQDVLADVECDAVITDPPYSERTHGKQSYGHVDKRNPDWVRSRGLGYTHWDRESVDEFLAHWSDRTAGWICSFTDSELYPDWRDSFRAVNRYVFAPLPAVQRGMNCRLAGDGPSSWTVWLVVARPRTREAQRWGTLPGAYVGNAFDRGENSATSSKRSGRVGGKPVWLMREVIGDYSRPGDLVCDPCAGGGTTLLAAVMEGRRAIGAECDPETFEKAVARLRKGWTRALPGLEATPASQGGLWDE